MLKIRWLPIKENVTRRLEMGCVQLCVYNSSLFHQVMGGIDYLREI
jgi:hypothetical protein